MRAFLLRLSIFLAPVLALGALGAGLLWRSSDAWSIAHVLEVERTERDAGRETLFQRQICAEEMRRYKLEQIRSRRPEILVAGSSTSMQFRSGMFGPYADRFYNAGGLTNASGQLGELADVIEALEERPRVLVIGVDLWWLNPAWQLPPSPPLESLLEDSGTRQDFDALMFGLRRMLSRPARLPWSKLVEAPGRAERLPWLPIGIGARGGNGFRGSDGSRRYAAALARADEGRPFKDEASTLDRIRTGTRRFEYATHVDDQRLSQVVAFLQRMRAFDVTVAGYAPPLAPTVQAALEASAPHRSLLGSYREAVKAAFAEAGQPFVDAVDVGAAGFTDENMIDGFHGSERVVASILARWLTSTTLAEVLPDLSGPELQVRLDGAGHPLRFAAARGAATTAPRPR